MPDLMFEVDGAAVVPFSETPLIVLRLRVSNPSGESIHSAIMRCQIMIETNRRRYSEQEQARLVELFGNAEQWKQGLRGTLWTIVNVLVPPFDGEIVTDVPLPCTFDFNVAATKYFAGLSDGEIPVCLLFSGTVFYHTEEFGLQVAQIAWDKEASYRLPVKLWHDLMDAYYPNAAWLSLRRDVFERLREFKAANAIPTWEQAFERLLTAETHSAG